MKRFGVAILQLEAMSLDTVLQAVKQAIFLNTQFFDSLSLHPPTMIDELFQRGNQYAMLEDDVVATTKQTVADTSDVGRDNGSKGNRNQDDQDRKGKRNSKESRRSGHRNAAEGSRDRVAENPGQDNGAKQIQFMVPPSQLLPLIQSFQGLSGLGLNREIKRGGISLGIASIIGMLGTKPTTAIAFEGC